MHSLRTVSSTMQSQCGTGTLSNRLEICTGPDLIQNLNPTWFIHQTPAEPELTFFANSVRAGPGLLFSSQSRAWPCMEFLLSKSRRTCNFSKKINQCRQKIIQIIPNTSPTYLPNFKLIGCFLRQLSLDIHTY